MEFPFTCQGCKKIILVDLERLEKKPINKVLWREGFSCECGEWNAVIVSSRQVSEALRKLAHRKVNRDFPYYLAKVLRRVRSLQEGI